MATITIGTNANNSLTGLQFTGNMAPADLATINAAIFNDSNPANNTSPKVAPSAFSTSGTLALPGGRGTITLQPGDYIAVDPNTGWPIVLSANAANNGAFTL